MKILFVSPVPLKQNKQSGINIRIHGVADFFKSHGYQVDLIDKFDPIRVSQYKYIYCLVSTKPDSITTKVVKGMEEKSKLILDLYTPIFLEKKLTFSPYKPTHWLNRRQQAKTVKTALEKATYFTTANKKQRSYWTAESKKLGAAIQPAKIAVIPTTHDFHLKSSKKGKVILWFGGVYPWLDPNPLARAFSNIAGKHPDWKIRVLGGHYGATDYDKIYKNFVKKLMSISKSQVEITPWQSPKALPKYLEDVSFAVHLPKNTPEDTYAHRVRLLTLTNSQIPILTSGTDVISQIILRSKAGVKVSRNADKLSEQILEIMKNPKQLSEMKRNTGRVEKIYLKRESLNSTFLSQTH